jgi:hypothetical protein
MTTDFYIELLASESDWQNDPDLPGYNPQPTPSVLAAEYNDGADQRCYLYASDLADPLPEWPASASVLAAWSQTGLQYGETYDTQEPPQVVGTPTYAIQQNYWDYVRPLGNSAGRATGPLRTVRFQGHPEVRYAVTDEAEYPVTDSPFTLGVIRDDHTYPDWDSVTTYDTDEKVMHGGLGYQSQQTSNTNHEPGAPGSGPWWLLTEFGWGWTATMIVQSTSQDPITNYNVRGYPDPACTPGTQIYTSGNFSDTGGGVFQSSMPSGNWTPTADQINIALIFAGGGNAQTGIITLEVGQDENTSLYWAADMP